MIAEIKKGFTLSAQWFFFLLKHPYLFIYLALPRFILTTAKLAIPSYKEYLHYNSIGGLIGGILTTLMGIILLHHTNKILQQERTSLFEILNARKSVIIPWIFITTLVEIIVVRLFFYYPNPIVIYILSPIIAIAFMLLISFMIVLISYDKDTFTAEIQKLFHNIRLFWRELFGAYVLLAGISICIFFVGFIIIISLHIPASIAVNFPVVSPQVPDTIKIVGKISEATTLTIIYSVLILVCSSLYKKEQRQEQEEMKFDARMTWMD